MKNYLLLDSEFDLDLLIKTKENFEKIVCFDLNSHLILEENQIDHILADEYIDKSTIEKIQSESFSFSKWYLNENLFKYIIYENINLGKLFNIQFMDMVVPFLTKFTQINNITKICPNISCTSSLYELVQYFSKNAKYFSSKSNIQNKKISYEYKFGKFNFTVNLSENQFKKIKNTVDLFLQSPFEGSKNKKSKNLLFIEIDPIKYKNLFINSENYDCRITLFNNRKPAVWNYDSWKIIKKSRSKIVNINSLFDSESKNKIFSGTSELKNQLNLMWSNDDYFSTFFSFNGLSFWEIFSKQFIPEINSKFLSFIEYIESTKKLFQKKHFDSILILSEAGVQEQITLQLAKQNKIPVVLLQHGVPYDTPNAISRNNLLGFFPNDSDFFISWGKIISKYVENFRISKDKIQDLGNPVFDQLFDHNDNTSNEFILIATSPPMKDFVIDNTVNVQINYYSILNEICDFLTKLNKKVIIKPHPSLEDKNLENFKHFENVEIIKNGDIIPLIKKCELLITFDLSTTILESQILKKPVLSISLKDYGFGKSEIFKRDTCTTTSIVNFPEELKKILSNNITYKQNPKINSFLKDYLSCQGNSAKSVLYFLSNL